MHFALLAYDEVPLELKVDERVMNIIMHCTTALQELSEDNVLLGEAFAVADTEVIQKHNILERQAHTVKQYRCLVSELVNYVAAEAIDNIW